MSPSGKFYVAKVFSFSPLSSMNLYHSGYDSMYGCSNFSLPAIVKAHQEIIRYETFKDTWSARLPQPSNMLQIEGFTERWHSLSRRKRENFSIPAFWLEGSQQQLGA